MPVPPPPAVSNPARVLAKVSVPPELVIVVEAVRPLKAVEEVAKVTAPVRALPGILIEVTTLEAFGRQVFKTAKQPAVRFKPLAKVEEAVFEVALNMVAESPAAKVEVPCPAPTVIAAAKVEVAVVLVAT